MKNHFLSAMLLLLSFQPGSAQSDSTFPVGALRGPFVWKSTIYPGTERNYWVYVPNQYDPSKPACTMIVQDGLSRAEGWHLPTTLDSLIALKEIPGDVQSNRNRQFAGQQNPQAQKETSQTNIGRADEAGVGVARVENTEERRSKQPGQQQRPT